MFPKWARRAPEAPGIYSSLYLGTVRCGSQVNETFLILKNDRTLHFKLLLLPKSHGCSKLTLLFFLLQGWLTILEERLSS